MRSRLVHLTTLTCSIAVCGAMAGCTTTPPPEPTTPPVIDQPVVNEAPDATARAEFADAYAAYAEATRDGSLSPDECDRVATGFDAVYQRHPRSMLVARYNVGAVWEECGDPAKASEVYQELANQGFHLGLNALGVIAWTQGDNTQALALFAASVDADKTQALAARNNLAAAYRDRYTSKAARADFDQAERQLQNVLAVDTSNKTAYENLARLYYDRGRLDDPSYLVLAHLVVSQAVQVLAARGLESADIHNLEGLLFMQDNNQVAALRAFERAVEIEPKHPDANRNIGFIAIRFRDYRRAEVALTTVLSSDAVGQDLEVQLALGVAERGLGKFAEAERRYLEVAALDEHDPRPWYNLAILEQDHWTSQDVIVQPELIAHYEAAKRHCRAFETRADHDPNYADAIEDCTDRTAIIDDALISFERAAVLERKMEQLQALEEEREAQRQADLLELERQAMAAGLPSPEDLADTVEQDGSDAQR